MSELKEVYFKRYECCDANCLSEFISPDRSVFITVLIYVIN